ncbi:hypothetical protein DFH09DRAFT_1306680 [Mycena vulgaris]|nr:hypothetical protein DFH09DRAFT_1306680 [Mycena vulgaris]
MSRNAANADVTDVFPLRDFRPISVVRPRPLALWDLLGKLRGESVYKMWISTAGPGLEPTATLKAAGFWEVPLPYGPDEGGAGLHKSVTFPEPEAQHNGTQSKFDKELLNPTTLMPRRRLNRASPTASPRGPPGAGITILWCLS